MYKFIFTFLFFMSLVSYASSLDKTMNLETSKHALVVGIWAMVPLKNGIANVVEFNKEGKSTLHSFNCNKKSFSESESSTYIVNEDKSNIKLISRGKTRNLNIVFIDKKTMILGQTVKNQVLEFSYTKVSRVSPLCDLYKKSKHDINKLGAFKKTDFINDPLIPDYPNIIRYMGKWADENGHVSIEVNKDDHGKYKLKIPKTENWNHLFNNIYWSGKELRFKVFSYSDKQNLFDHPYHKSVSIQVLTPVDDLNKIKWSFFIDDKRFDYILTRK